MTATGDDRNRAAVKHFQDMAVSWSDRYREGRELSRSFFIRRQAVEWQLQRLAKREHELALDLGCGTGPYLTLLARFARKVVGVDVAPAMIEEAKRNLPPGLDNVSLVVASVFDLPLPDAHFDIGVCVGLLEYFDDPLTVLRAAFRVMKPGGSIVFTVPSVFGIARLTGLPRTLTLLAPPRWKVRAGAVFDRLRGREPDPSRYYLGACFTFSRMRRLCEEAGFELAELTTSDYTSFRIAGLPILARFESAVDRLGEANRQNHPWKYLGNNLIVTIRKRSFPSSR